MARKPCKSCAERRKWLIATSKKLGVPMKGAAEKLMSKMKGRLK